MSYEYASTLFDTPKQAALACIEQYITAGGSAAALARGRSLAGAREIMFICRIPPHELAAEMRRDAWTVPYLDELEYGLAELIAMAQNDLVAELKSDE